MSASTAVAAKLTIPCFPTAEVTRRLQGQLEKIAGQSSVLRPPWEPLLDSKMVVGSVLVLEDLFPFRIPPDRIVQKGGYRSVNEATRDMVGRLEKIWIERGMPQVNQ